MNVIKETLQNRKVKNFFKVFVIILLILTVIKYVFGISRVSGDSMSPTYQNGEYITANRFYETITYNDVVTLHPTSKIGSPTYIKRVVALPGDTVLIKDGYLHVNGSLVEDGFGKTNYPGIAKDEITLKEDEYFVMGDNRNNSVDSRTIGAIPKSQIIAIVNQ